MNTVGVGSAFGCNQQFVGVSGNGNNVQSTASGDNIWNGTAVFGDNNDVDTHTVGSGVNAHIVFGDNQTSWSVK